MDHYKRYRMDRSIRYPYSILFCCLRPCYIILLLSSCCRHVILKHKKATATKGGWNPQDMVRAVN